MKRNWCLIHFWVFSPVWLSSCQSIKLDLIYCPCFSLQIPELTQQEIFSILGDDPTTASATSEGTAASEAVAISDIMATLEATTALEATAPSETSEDNLQVKGEVTLLIETET